MRRRGAETPRQTHPRVLVSIISRMSIPPRSTGGFVRYVPLGRYDPIYGDSGAILVRMAGMFARVQVSLDRDGLIPEDVATNTWHFDGDWDSATEDRRARWDEDAPGLVARIITFYQTIAGQLSSTLAGTGTVRVYDMHDARERIPRVVTPFTFTPGDGALPGEVAVCLSFKAVD